MKKLKLFEGLAKQKIYEYKLLKDYSIEELAEVVRNCRLPEPNEEDQWLLEELEDRLDKVFGYEEKYGTKDTCSILNEIRDGKYYSWEEYRNWLLGEIDRYRSVVNESKMRVNESRNPRKGDIVVIDGDLEVKVLHCFTSAKSAAAYERKVNITKDDGYSISEKINSGVIDANESGLYVYALYEDKIKLFDFTDEDVDWEIKDKK